MRIKRDFTVDSVSGLKAVAASLIALIDGERYNILEFYGEMGTGKTTLIREICSQLGVIDIVTSPTFAIINEYEIANSGNMCYHFDFYRINKLEEVLDMGYEEYFYSGNISFIEWPELIQELLPTGDDDGVKPLKIRIELASNGARHITF